MFDAISARIALDLGFELAMFAGSVASMTVLGAPDLVVLTLSEFAGQAYRISRAADLPLIVDADHGYGKLHSGLWRRSHAFAASLPRSMTSTG